MPLFKTLDASYDSFSESDCENAQVSVLISTYFQDFLTAAYRAAHQYYTPPLVNGKKRIPGNPIFMDSLRVPFTNAYEPKIGDNHLPTQRVWDNCLRYYIVYNSLDDNNIDHYETVRDGSGSNAPRYIVYDSNDRPLIRPERQNVGGVNVLIPIPQSQMPPDFAHTPFFPEAAVLFTWWIFTIQMNSGDSATGGPKYNAFSRLRFFLLNRGFSEDYLIGDGAGLLDPGNNSGRIVGLVKDAVEGTSLFTKRSDAIYNDKDLTNPELIKAILDDYAAERERLLNEVSNCIYRGLGGGADFQVSVLGVGDGSPTNGLMGNLFSAGVLFTKYTYGTTANSANETSISTTTFKFIEDRTEGKVEAGEVQTRLHVTAWAFNQMNIGAQNTSLAIRVGDEEYNLTAKYDSNSNNAGDNEIFYPAFIFNTATYINRFAFAEKTFQWRKKGVSNFFRKDRIATYFAKQQTFRFNGNQTGEFDLAVTRASNNDEVIVLAIAYTAGFGKIPSNGTPPLAFVLDSEENFRDNTFTLLTNQRSSVWRTQEDKDNLDVLINLILTRAKATPPETYALQSILNGNGIGMRPKLWYPGDTYNKGDYIIYSLTNDNKFQIFQAGQTNSGSTFNPNHWGISNPVIPKYDPLKLGGYKIGEKVVYNETNDPLKSRVYQAYKNIPSPTTILDKTKWVRQSMVSQNTIQKDFMGDPNTRSVHEKEYHSSLRYSFGLITFIENVILFNIDAFVSPIRSRLDRAFRDYTTTSHPLVIGDLDKFTLLNPLENSAAGNPDTNNSIPIYPPGSPFYNDERVWAPKTNNDYPKDKKDPPNLGADHAFVDNISPNSWLPIYNPLLSNLRAFGMLEELTIRINERANERVGVGPVPLNNNDVLIIAGEMTKLLNNTHFTVLTYNTLGNIVEKDFDLIAYNNFKFQPQFPKPLPAGQFTQLFNGGNIDPTDVDDVDNYNNSVVDDSND